jgi:hypothetical protein
MDYQNVVKDFAERTRKNLHLLRQLQQKDPDQEILEVTQLINSMLGLLVFPQQRYFNQIPQPPLSELKDQGWPIPQVVGDYPQVSVLRELVRYLRNAVAHFNVEFTVGENQQISGLKVWNYDPRRRRTTWKAELTLEQIEDITERFLDILRAEQTDPTTPSDRIQTTPD